MKDCYYDRTSYERFCVYCLRNKLAQEIRKKVILVASELEGGGAKNLKNWTLLEKINDEKAREMTDEMVANWIIRTFFALSILLS